MDSDCEQIFLELLKEYPKVVQKGNDKYCVKEKEDAWFQIKEKLLASTGKEYDTLKLKKKWNNISNRVKETIRKRKATGGGPYKPSSGNDELAVDIIGCSNPVLSQLVDGIDTAVVPSVDLLSAGKVDSVSRNTHDSSFTQSSTQMKRQKLMCKDEVAVMMKERLEIEKERVEIEKQRLNVEKQRLEVEKARLTIEKWRSERQPANTASTSDANYERYNASTHFGLSYSRT